MPIIEELNATPNGARFLRADLHIHSFGHGGSYDVRDEQMTPANIVDVAIRENLDLIAIADHNQIGNVQAAIDAASGKNLLVIPAVELSTPDGHLLIYMPDVGALTNFFGKLSISADRQSCTQTIVQCLDSAAAFGGFGVAAHIDIDKGFEVNMTGYTPFKKAIVTHKHLLAMEIASVSSESWFTDRDSSTDRKGLLSARRMSLDEDNTYDIAKVMSSDAHTLNALGKNATGNRRLTRLKMDQMSYHSFKIALLDSSARVRIEDLIPPTVPKFVGIKFDGGFLDGQVIRLSSNLNCIIGGRGAGKSTVLESIRAGTGNVCRESMIDNDVWPDRISLLYEDETGRQQIFVKDKSKSLVNQTDPTHGIQQAFIESFGQGETAETIQHSGKDPSVLINFFDSFIDFQQLKSDDMQLCQLLLDNQTAIERLALEVESIPHIEIAKKNAEDQVAMLKTKNAKEIVDLEQALANERSLRDSLVNNLRNLILNVKKGLADKSVFTLVRNFQEENIQIGKEEFKKVKEIVEEYSLAIDEISGTLNANSDRVAADINQRLTAWKEKEATVQNKIEEIRKEIEGKGGKLDMAFIRKITKDASDFAVRLDALYKKREELKEMEKERKKLLDLRKNIKGSVYKKRLEFVTLTNNNLKNTVIDFLIDIKLKEGVHAPELASIIKDTMGWRTTQVAKADLIVSQVPYFSLLESIHKNNTTVIMSVKGNDGQSFFGKNEADDIITRLRSKPVLGKIERCSFEDIPVITVTRKIEHTDGTVRHLSKDFSSLSLGQQQSILLSILLFSKRNCPLLIDQPEDNLDSEFIYKTLVKNLRKIKEHRQVIIVTHNANIAVLGDAELIVPLKSTSERTVVVDRGSIDTPVTKKISCSILEGGEKAFLKRKEIYGY